MNAFVSFVESFRDEDSEMVDVIIEAYEFVTGMNLDHGRKHYRDSVLYRPLPNDAKVLVAFIGSCNGSNKINEFRLLHRYSLF